MRGGALFKGKEGRGDFRKNSFFKGKEGRGDFRKNYFFAKEETEEFESAYVPITP